MTGALEAVLRGKGQHPMCRCEPMPLYTFDRTLPGCTMDQVLCRACGVFVAAIAMWTRSECVSAPERFGLRAWCDVCSDNYDHATAV